MRLLRVYLQSARLHTQAHIIYRASIMIWLFSMLLEPVVFMMVWRAVAVAEGTTVGGHTQATLTAYFLVLMVVNHLTFSWIMHEYAYRIQHGILAGLLLYPLHPIHRDITDNVTYKLLVMVVVGPVLVVLSVLLQPEFNFEAWQVLAFVPALLLAAATRFLMEWTLAQSAFWYIETGAFSQAYMVILMFFSGRLGPIDMFPDWLAAIARYLPFWLSVAFPVETILGNLTPNEILSGIALQAVWLTIFVAIVTLVWNLAIRRFGAVGS